MIFAKVVEILSFTGGADIVGLPDQVPTIGPLKLHFTCLYRASSAITGTRCSVRASRIPVDIYILAFKASLGHFSRNPVIGIRENPLGAAGSLT